MDVKKIKFKSISINKSLIFSILVFVLSFICTFSYILSNNINNLDEMWNYNTARQIHNGLIPYRDISMITTPLLPMIHSLFLNIYDNLIVSRILASVIASIIILLTYKIFFKMTKNILFSFIISMLICYSYREFFVIDYNYAILLIELIITNLELGKVVNNNQTTTLKLDIKYNLLIGILCGIAVCTKQTIGMFICFFVLIKNLLYIRKKDDFKEFLKIDAFYILGMLIPILLFFIYLFANKAIGDFINYCFLGIKDFTNIIPYNDIFKYANKPIKIAAFLFPIIIIVSTFTIEPLSKKNLTENKYTEILWIYSLPLILFIYPIADESHFQLAIFILIIYTAYFIFSKIHIKQSKNMRDIISITTLLVLFFIIKSLISFQIYIKSDKKYKEASSFKNLILNNYSIELYEETKKIINETNKKVIILSGKAVQTDIMLNRYFKNYDMLLKGNIGKNGVNNIIDEIKNSHDCYYLILSKDNWQFPTEISKYVTDNCKYIKRAYDYFVYYKE